MENRLKEGEARVIGIDPGTKSFDICGLEGDRVFLDISIPTTKISDNPRVLAELLRSAGPLDLVVGPSGYGLPWVHIRDLGPQEMNLLLLSSEQDRGLPSIIGGMRAVIELLKRTDLPILFVPGVIHLDTVPPHRKVNRIDMGTADKLCAAALGIYDQCRRLKIPYDAASFLFVELGGAFSAVLAVERGKIVDGLGGTSGPVGYLAAGGMDGELAYLLGGFHKALLCSGGLAHIAGHPEWQVEELLGHSDTDLRCKIGWQAFWESLTKSVAAEIAVVPSAKEILISGRLCRVPEINRQVIEHLSIFAPVSHVSGFAQVAKEAAQGAALIAAGLVGSKYEELVKTMGIGDARGTSLDNIYVNETDRLAPGGQLPCGKMLLRTSYDAS